MKSFIQKATTFCKLGNTKLSLLYNCRGLNSHSFVSQTQSSMFMKIAASKGNSSPLGSNYAI